ncbi:GntR family transcriptional regulator [Kocuria sp.]|uniref:GntR family transcriptional regulator n=1 Tax=Kocuria sp. TaxID=1871328 RepID=UPI0026E0B777|nr:GntR family transcriptional regulator [Kocuria sp.]MDO5619477.1 GntR family transcriptional regulator [Kocuria sp.]
MRASQRVYEQLRTEIMDGDLPPGQVLAEVEQSQRFGISRTPVREAIGRLAAEGLAEAQGGRGVVVSEVTVDDIPPLFELREALDIQAARLAALRGEPAQFAAMADRLDVVAGLFEVGAHREGTAAHAEDGQSHPEEHDSSTAYYELVAQMDRAIDAAAANPWLDAASSTVRMQLARVRRLAAHDAPRLAAAAREHAQIARAISTGSAQLAEAAVRLHLHNALSSALSKAPANHPQPAVATREEAS